MISLHQIITGWLMWASLCYFQNENGFFSLSIRRQSTAWISFFLKIGESRGLAGFSLSYVQKKVHMFPHQEFKLSGRDRTASHPM